MKTMYELLTLKCHHRWSKNEKYSKQITVLYEINKKPGMIKLSTEIEMINDIIIKHI